MRDPFSMQTDVRIEIAEICGFNNLIYLPNIFSFKTFVDSFMYLSNLHKDARSSQLYLTQISF